jgi:hypothetical protein
MFYVMVLVVMVVTVMHGVVLCESIRAKQQCADRQSDRHKRLFHDSNSSAREEVP